MSQQDYPHEKFGLSIRGTQLSARTAKMQHATGVYGQFNVFWVPHRQSLPVPYNKNGAMVADQFVQNLLARHEGSSRTLPVEAMVRAVPITKETADMRPQPIEVICHRMAHTLDVAPNNRPMKLSAIDNIKMEVCGHVCAGMRFAARDGAIFSVFGKRKLSSDFGAESQSGGMYIRVRSTAAYQRVSMTLPNIRGMSYQDCAIEGRFDIITLRDAYSYGIVPLARPLEALYDPLYARDVFTIQEIHSQLEAVPTLAAVKTLTEEGEAVIIKRARRKKIIGDSAAL